MVNLLKLYPPPQHCLSCCEVGPHEIAGTHYFLVYESGRFIWFRRYSLLIYIYLQFHGLEVNQFTPILNRLFVIDELNHGFLS